MNRHAIVAEIPRLRRYARALTGDVVRADDLVQDTLERALGKWSLWRPGNLRAWLFSIMHNLFVNQVRSPRLIEYPGDEALPELPVRENQGDALELRDFARSLSRLPEEQREVLLLVGLEDLSYEDAARVLGVPIGTVMSRLSRGRERLRALLAGSEPAETHLKAVK
ncbi:MAG: sigma-70 family RNA polymerase sigma factor [Rhodocyclales bacterium]|nr:sigma-70 family RNA polymerase sigma factor [Rhodocyclales bacterium]